MQTLMQTVNSLVSGLAQVKSEVAHTKALRVAPEGDRFVYIMEEGAAMLNVVEK